MVFLKYFYKHFAFTALRRQNSGIFLLTSQVIHEDLVSYAIIHLVTSLRYICWPKVPAPPITTFFPSILLL